MALKFVAAKRKDYKPRKSLLLSKAQPKAFRQDYEVVDQFGDVAARKRAAGAQARKLGHDLRPWHRRPNDPAGRWNAFCTSCNRALVVCTETPLDFEDIYGPAFSEDCQATPAPNVEEANDSSD